MKSNQFHEHPHIKREINTSPCSSPLKINIHSHFIKKSPSPPSSSSSSATSAAVATAAKPQQPRQPVIIYTHSPKVIHTQPRDFMALVQKLTGLSRPENDPPPRGDASGEEDPKPDHHDRRPQPSATAGSDESDTTSVITEEHCSSMNSSVGNMQAINSNCLSGPPPSFPVFDPPNPCFSNMPLFPNDYLCQTTPFYNSYAESAFFMPNMRSSLSPSSLDGIKESPDF